MNEAIMFSRRKFIRHRSPVMPPGRAERQAARRRMIRRMKERRLAGDSVLDIAWDFGLAPVEVKRLLESEQ